MGIPTLDKLPKTYKKESHPVIEMDDQCLKCELGVRTKRINNSPPGRKEEGRLRHCSVGGAGPDDLSKVKLIILSDHPGHYESRETHVFPMVDISLEQNSSKGMLRSRNAGAFLRRALNLMFDLDTYNDCWITNAVKCNPFEQSIIESKHLKPCVNQWLISEFSLLKEYCPTAPLLVAGSHAFRACKLMYRKDAAFLQQLGLNGCRRRGDIVLDGRPVIFTDNPAKICRCEAMIETEVKTKKGRVSVTKNDWFYLPGSPVYGFVEDLKFLSDFL